MYAVTQSKKHCAKFKEKVKILEHGYRSYVIKFYALGSRISCMNVYEKEQKKINNKTNDRTKKSEETPFFWANIIYLMLL